MSVLETTDIFEERSTLWRAILEYNPELHQGLKVEELSDSEIDKILADNADKLVLPQRLLKWKYHMRDKQPDGTTNPYYVIQAMYPPGYQLTEEDKTWQERNDKETQAMHASPTEAGYIYRYTKPEQ